MSTVDPRHPSMWAPPPGHTLHHLADDPRIPFPAPPGREPRDWRWAVRGLGKSLVTIGLLIFAFAGYQLWGTGIQHARAQSQLADRFAEQRAVLERATTTTAAPVTVATSPAPAASSLPGSTTSTPAIPTTAAPIPSVQLTVGLGDVLGLMTIERIGLTEWIVDGVRAADLDKGVGHYPYTPLPGHTGNVAIAGHRTTHGQPFFDLDKLAPGDEIKVETLEGTFTYTVTGSKIVAPTDFTVLFGDPARSELTLTTCHPKYTQRQRLVVSAVLDEARSQPSGYSLAYDPTRATTAPDDPPTDTTADSPVIGAGAPLPTTTSAVPASTVPASTAADLIAAPAAATQDAFASGWFSDPGAWPGVALWGAALVATWLAGRWVGRRTRRWLGPLVIAGPFVVLLYFWFENVSRLLPPNL